MKIGNAGGVPARPWLILGSLLVGAAIIANCGNNLAPSTPPEPTGPDSGYVRISYHFSVRVAEAMSESLEVRFFWDNADTSVWATVSDGDSATVMSHAWPEPGTYDVRAQFKNVHGSSEWSPGLPIAIREQGESLWARAYGDSGDEQGQRALQTADLGVLVVGTTRDRQTHLSDIYVVKTDVGGDVRWTRKLGGPGYEYGAAADRTADGGYIIAGGTESYGAGSEDAYLIKLNADGDTVWTRTYGGPEREEFWAVRQALDGGYIAAGRVEATDSTQDDIYIVKTDASGNQEWTRRIGGLGNQDANSVNLTGEGYIVAALNEPDASNFNDYVIRIDAQGNVLWANTYGGNDAFDAVQTADGGFIIAAEKNYRVYLIRTDGQGNRLWTRDMGGTGCNRPVSVLPASGGGLLVGGYSDSYYGSNCLYLMRTDSIGQIEWVQTYGRDCMINDGRISACSDGGFLIVGNTTQNHATTGTDILVVRTRPIP